jgi:hypothetical protein
LIAESRIRGVVDAALGAAHVATYLSRERMGKYRDWTGQLKDWNVAPSRCDSEPGNLA